MRICLWFCSWLLHKEEKTVELIPVSSPPGLQIAHFDCECCDDPNKSCILVLVPHHILGPHPGNQTPLPLLRSESRNEIYRFQISGGGIAWPSLIPSEGPPCSKPSSARLFHPHTHVLPCQAPVCRYEIRESGRDWRPLPAYSVFSGVTCLSSSLPRLISQPLSALTTSVSRNISK